MSRVDELLKEYRAALDDARDRRVQSPNPSDERGELDLVEQMTLDCVRGLLEDLGEQTGADDSADKAIARASAAVGEHKERFVKDAPLTFLERQIGGLNQVLRDIGYLRDGFGLGSELPKPADMRWSHATGVRSYVVRTMGEVAGALKSGGAEVHRLIPEVNLDFSTHRGIVELLTRELGASEFMDAAIDLGKRQMSVAGWDAFRDLPYEDESNERSSFFVDVIQRDPPKAPLAGLYAEITYPSRRGETVADLDLSGSDSYQPGGEEWFGLINYWPKNASAGSDVLASIHRLAHVPGGLGNSADYTLCLAWSAYLARACGRQYVGQVLADRIGCRVGFSGGDWIELGWIERG